MFKGIGYILAGLIILAIVVIGGSFADLEYSKFFRPRQEDVRREVFENTKSYTHGKTQDLAKYYEEYQQAESMDNKQAIEGLIKMNFADFEAENIRVYQLKQFLVSVRGY